MTKYQAPKQLYRGNHLSCFWFTRGKPPQLAGMAATGSSKKLREDIFNHRREQREWTGSGVRIKMFKPCPKWCTSPSKTLCPKSSVTSPNCNTSQSPSVQTWADGDISHSNHRSRSLAIYVGHSANGLSKMDFTHWEERPIGIYNIWVHSVHVRRQRDSGFPLPRTVALLGYYCIVWPRQWQRTC